MSELKAYTYDDMIDGDADTNIEYYPKSEADKVIADLEESHKMEAEQLLMKIVELKEKLVEQATLRAWAELQLRHNKYKRCLDKAEWCDSEMNYWYDRIEMEQCPRFKFFARWQKRWLELAEKFKEAK